MIDWAAAHARLARTAAALAGERAPDEVTRILRARAIALSRPVHEDRAPGRMIEVVVVEAGGERYALDAALVTELAHLRALVPVPGVPAHVAGVALWRGRLLTVVDLGPLFDLPPREPRSSFVAAVVGRDERAMALLVDRVLGVEVLPAAERAEVSLTAAGAGRAFCRPLPGRAFAMLEAEALIDDPRVLVDQEVDPR